MLQSMRERTQGIIAVTIVALICITFALWGVQYYLRGNRANNIVAKVDGIDITQNDMRFAYERVRQQIAHTDAKLSFDQEEQKQLKQKVLQQLIQKQIFMQAAGKLGLFIGNRQLRAMIMQLPIFQIEGKFSLDRFQEILSKMFYTENSFLQDMQNSLMQTQLVVGVASSVFILPNEIDEALKLENQKRDISYFLLQKKRFLPKIKIGEKEINDYYLKHQDAFMMPESVSIDYVQLTADKLTNQLGPITVEALKKFYKDNIDLYSTPKLWQIAEIKSKIPEGASEKEVDAVKSKMQQMALQAKSGEVFDKLTPEQSKVFWLSSKEMGPDVTKEIEKLQPGEISTPIRTKDSYSLLKLVAVKNPEILPFEQVRDRVNKTYTQQKMLQLFSEQNEKLAELAYTNSDSLVPVAKALNLEIKSTDAFTRKGSKVGLEKDPKIVKVAFSDLVLNHGYNSNPIEIAPGNVIVLRLKKHIPAKARSLEVVRTNIEQNLKDLMAQERAKSLSKEILTALQHGTQPQQLAKKYRLVWHSILSLGRQDAKVPAEIVEAAFSLAKKEGTETRSPVTTVNLSEGDCAVVLVNKIIDNDLQKISAEQREKFAKTLWVKFGEYDYNLLTAAMMRQAKVKMMGSLFNDG